VAQKKKDAKGMPRREGMDRVEPRRNSKIGPGGRIPICTGGGEQKQFKNDRPKVTCNSSTNAMGRAVAEKIGKT